jgi:hypothetical protein
VAPPPPGSSARKKQKKKKKSAAAAAEAAGSEGDGEGDGHVIARLQELGPRFTMKLQSLQKGVFDPTRGEFEWVRPAPGDAAGASRRKFFL